MAIISKTFGVAGQTGVAPRRVQLVTTDNLATVTAANYLTAANLLPDVLFPTDIIDMIYSFNTSTGHGTYGEFLPNIVGSTITLLINSGEVVGPTLPNHLIVSTNTTGSLANLTGTAINDGSIQAGRSGIPGGFISFPTTAANGQLIVQATNSSANVNTTITSTANTVNQTVSIPDAFTPTSNFIISAGQQLMQSGSSIVFAKNSASEAGGMFSCTASAGILTTAALTTAGGANVTIPWINGLALTTSVVAMQIVGGTNTVWDISVLANVVSANNINITIYNNTAATALNGTIVLYFILV